MDFEARFKALAAENKPDDLVVPFYTPEEGEEVYGILLGIETVQNEKVKEPCNRYIMETQTGTISMLFGAATDKQLAGKIEIGLLTYVKYEGKFSIDNGARQVNRWKVLQVPSDGQLDLTSGN